MVKKWGNYIGQNAGPLDAADRSFSKTTGMIVFDFYAF